MPRDPRSRPALIFHPAYSVDIGVHVFPVQKYRLVQEDLLRGGGTRPEDWFEPLPATSEELQLVHTAEYLDDLEHCRWNERTSASELPLTPQIAAAYALGAGGTILACCKALERGLAANLGGGFHHAFADRAEGFCYINDIAVGIRAMQRQELIARAAVIDCDLHQGNGTAHIFSGDDSVFTFSIHQEDLYPVKQASDWDIGLENETGDSVYLEELGAALPRILERARPDLVVYQAGADPFCEDQLGNLNLSLEGMKQRDQLVLSACTERGVPCAITFGGGYARRLEDTVQIHVNTCRTALELAVGIPGDSR